METFISGLCYAIAERQLHTLQVIAKSEEIKIGSFDLKFLLYLHLAFFAQRKPFIFPNWSRAISFSRSNNYI